jgi:hypothetical protein
LRFFHSVRPAMMPAASSARSPRAPLAFSAINLGASRGRQFGLGRSSRLSGAFIPLSHDIERAEIAPCRPPLGSDIAQCFTQCHQRREFVKKSPTENGKKYRPPVLNALLGPALAKETWMNGRMLPRRPAGGLSPDLRTMQPSVVDQNGRRTGTKATIRS